MAYYDSFTKKTSGKRGDRRDGGDTRRHAQDTGYGELRSEQRYAKQPSQSKRRYDEHPRQTVQNDDKRPQQTGQRHEERQTRPAPVQDEPQENLLVGRNPIREALASGRDMEKLLVARGNLTGSAREIVAIAQDRHIRIQQVDRAKLDAMAAGHQGLIALVSAYAYKTVEDMLALAKSRGEDPLLVLLDGVTDPHNLGAIIRSAECVGAHGVIIPERRAVGLTAAAVKASAGAVEHIPVAREVNLSRTIERLKREGIWVYGAAMNGEDYRSVSFSGPAALVIGSEGEGLGRLVREHCDKLISLPVRGKIASLNASVAAGVLLYAIENARETP